MSRLFLALCVLISLASCGQPTPLAVKDVWARDTIGGTDDAAVFMTITSSTADRLVAASTPIARTVDLMTMQGGSNAMEMTYLKSIDIPAGKPVSLNPTGLHVWLTDMTQPLRTGQVFALTLDFQKAGRRTVMVSVIAPSAAPPVSGTGM